MVNIHLPVWPLQDKISLLLYRNSDQLHIESQQQTVHENCPYSEFFWSTFSRIYTEYRKIRSIFPYPIQMWQITDQKNSKYKHFSRSEKQ